MNLFVKGRRGRKMLNGLKKNILLALLIPVIAGCSSNAKDTLGLRRTAPDEFKVISNPPLSMPPEFSLRPPSSGEDKAAVAAANETEVKNILEKKPSSKVAKAEANQKTTKGEGAFLGMAGAEDTDSQIKAILTAESEQQAKQEKEKGFLDKIASFSNKDAKDTQPVLVKANAEKDRITKNKEEGKPVTEGETPTVAPAKKGLLQNVFGF
jgi:hypothetical protein